MYAPLCINEHNKLRLHTRAVHRVSQQLLLVQRQLTHHEKAQAQLVECGFLMCVHVCEYNAKR